MKEIIEYIITWLCYGNAEVAKRVAYTADEKAIEQYDVLIIPCGQLGKNIVLPDMSKPIVDKIGKGKFIIRTDIVYNTFFFISRAEEVINHQRDKHGRFLAQYSMLGHLNRLQIPILDEYAHMLLRLLNADTPEPGFEHIYLTHDIDSISQYRHLRGAIGGLIRGEGKAVWQACTNILQDPLFTFPWIIEQDAQLQNAETIYFVKHTHGKGFDYPQYALYGHDFRQLKQTLLHSGAKLGIHSSYYGGALPTGQASLPFREGMGVGHLLHRSHFLKCSIEQMQRIEDAGYTDDFTMGFADQAGFRLQTSRAVKWINPKTMKISNLTLHPLIIMDTTLSNQQYMKLNEDEAYFLCERLIGKVRMHHGDLCLLWHNSSFTPDTYHKSLYSKIIQLLND